MKFEQIRNATIRLHYKEYTILVDPWLLPKGAMGCFRDFPMFKVTEASQLDIPMPMTALPMSEKDLLAGVDCIILTHIHPDHIDMAGDGTVGATIPKEIPIYAQSETDAAVLRKSGFTNVSLLTKEGQALTATLTVYKTPALHGTQVSCGDACGFVVKADGEPTVYVAGDTIWYEAVGITIKQYAPDVIVTNACAATLAEYGRLIMDTADVIQVVKAAPEAKVIASHMDAVAHAMLNRAALRKELAAAGMLDKVQIPADGEMYNFTKA